MTFRSKEALEDSKSNLIYIDFSDLLLFTKDELDKAIARLPDLKLKHDVIEQNLSVNPTQVQESAHHVARSNVRPASVNTSSVLKSIYASQIKKELSMPFQYGNPIPPSMTHINLSDYCGTDIDWKMLTLSRPPTKLEEEYFSKMVELNQRRHKTRLEDGHGFRKAVFQLSRHPRVMQYKPMSLVFDSFGFKCNEERKSIVIKEDIAYDSYSRVPLENEIIQRSEESLAAAAALLSDGNSLNLKMFSNHN